MEEIKKPLPVIDGDSKVFWENCRQDKLMIQQCQDCHRFYFYPRIFCPYCMSDHVEWKEASGKGKIYSYTIAHRPAGPAFAEDAPYAVAIVELDEKVRFMTNIINTPLEEIRCEMPVHVAFRKVSDEFHLPFFEQVKE